MGQTWTEFLTERERTRALGLRSAEALSRGDLSGASPALDAWRHTPHGPLVEAALDRALRFDDGPLGAARGHALAPPEALPTPPDPGRRLPARLWRRWLESQPVDYKPAGAPRGSWALTELAWYGAELERGERKAWADERYPADTADAQYQGLWSAWFRMDHARLYWTWPELVGGAAGAAVAHMLEARRVPVDARKDILRRVREELYMLFLGDSDGPMGWRELASRLVEGSGSSGPVLALASALDAESRAHLVRCVLGSGTWSWSTRQIDLSSNYNASPDDVEAVLGLHATLALLRSWTDPAKVGTDASLRVLYHHRDRARGRLRALVRDQRGPELQRCVLALPSLRARTLAGVKLYLWAWAHVVFKDVFQLEPRVVTPSCLPPDPPTRPEPRPFDPTLHALERAWVLLVILRGQSEALRRYIWGEEDSGGTFSHLLALLQGTAADPGEGPNRSYRALKRSLRLRGPAYEAAAAPIVAQIAALEPGRGVNRRALAILEPVWHPALALPERGFPSMIEHARRWRATEAT